ELACLHDRYDECIALLDRSQHEAASLRRRLKSAVNRSSSARRALGPLLCRTATGLISIPPLLALPRRCGGVVAGASQVAPPPPYELSLMSELERSASAESGLIGIVALHSKREKRANANHCQSIRRRHQQQQQQHHAQAKTAVRTIIITIAQHSAFRPQCQSRIYARLADRNRRELLLELAASAAAADHEPGRRGGVSGAGDGSGLEPDCFSVGNLTSPLMESSSTQLATETGNNSTVNNSGFIIDSEFSSPPLKLLL
uniref:DUF630 domain-containing protein n=1 Tax=Macrostomum lignano TaxID=282301 RepID=A0A1I8FCX2_9PLAT